MKTKNILLIIAAVFVLGIIAMLTGCNPVKRVLKDPVKMGKVFDAGVEKGWCVNDTVIVSKSDTLISYDTLYSLDLQTDTFNVDHEIVKVKTVVKTVHIRDTTREIVTDNSRIILLQKRNEELREENAEAKKLLVKATDLAEAFQKQRNKWRFRFWLLVAVIGLILFRKPLLKLATKIISPIKI